VFYGLKSLLWFLQGTGDCFKSFNLNFGNRLFREEAGSHSYDKENATKQMPGFFLNQNLD